VLWLEHRFFGKSLPFEAGEAFQKSADRVGLLSLEQSMLDYAAIIREHRGEGPVMTFGGSLSGTIAAIMRINHPTLVDMAYASSAPLFGVQGVADPFAWSRRVTENFAALGGIDCPGYVRRAFAALMRPENGDALAYAFQRCTCDKAGEEADGWRWTALAQKIWALFDQLGTYNYPYGGATIASICGHMERASHVSAEAIAATLVPILQPPPAQSPGTSECFNLTKATEKGVTRGMDRSTLLGWSYMACTEVVHPIGTNNHTDMFPPNNWTVDSLTASCWHSWNVTPDAGYLLQKAEVRVKGRGADAQVEPTTAIPGRILFTAGQYDPWSTMVPAKGWRDDVRVLKVPGGSHCSDLETPQPYDTEGMRATRQEVASVLVDWIRLVRPVRRMKVRRFGGGGIAAPNATASAWRPFGGHAS
jgi:pimeloyl-ACP methyl ester carboxylesterase